MNTIKQWILIALALVVLTGCASLWQRDKVTVAAGEVHTVLVPVVDGKTEKTHKSRTQFVHGDMVYAYMTLGWDQNLKARQLAVQWRNAASTVMTQQERAPNYVRDPHHVWFWINSAQLGLGTVSAQILVDGQVVQTIPFTVIAKQPYRPHPSWYQRIRGWINDKTEQQPTTADDERAQIYVPRPEVVAPQLPKKGQ